MLCMCILLPSKNKHELVGSGYSYMGGYAGRCWGWRPALHWRFKRQMLGDPTQDTLTADKVAEKGTATNTYRNHHRSVHLCTDLSRLSRLYTR
jgi:hypothetical protein